MTNFLASNQNFLLYILATLTLAIVFLAFWLWHLNKRLKNILGGKKSSDIETSILDNHQRLKNLETFQGNTLENLNGMEKRLKRSIQSIETVRFNPFKGTGAGGNQSFSTAFLNEKGDGVVLTGLYSRERVSIYAKPFRELRGEFEFSDEEKEAIAKARDSVNKKD